ncbi:MULTISPECIES: hypothetical protein [unclassified Alteromonas]|uniref:hypothetical protein n=1 Tax=unclassified Alteromonas TaxID=2614992 RepID=UPI0016539A35|nr:MULTISPECIES: hypothetical protein [unclassified Alteromonas]MBC6987356.1 hypothetical protein [Alteromonas sp. BZK5]MCG7643546.1 hypothetical protein [Alteromonas sp. MmMcT2-2]
MYTTNITNTTNYTTTTVHNNNFINNHCSRKRFRELRSQCKLNDSICSNAKTQKKDAKLIQDFYSALRIEDRDSALSAIVSNDGFLKRNSDNFYRYLDNPRWVAPDFDRLAIGYGISKEKSLKISSRLRAGDCPENTTLEHGLRNKYYKSSWVLKYKKGHGIRLYLISNNGGVDFRHIKVDFTPSYFRDSELAEFFNWFNELLGSERKRATKDSIISLMENGLQLHNVFAPQILHNSLFGKEEKYNWKIKGKEQPFTQATYDIFKAECGGTIKNKIYCPVSKLFYLIFKERRYTEDDALTVMENISHATRVESVYVYSYKHSAKKYSLLEMERVPCFLSQFDIIAPDSLVEMPIEDRVKLMGQRTLSGIERGNTRNLILSPNTLETKRIKMLERYKDIFLNS